MKGLPRLAVAHRWCVALVLLAAGPLLPAAPNAGAQTTTPPTLAPPNLRAQLLAARTAEDHAATVELCRRLLSGEARNDAGLLADMARAQTELRDFDRARATLDLLEKSPGRPPMADLLTQRGDLALAADRPADALAAWRSALEARPAPADPAPILGRVIDLHERRNDWAAAVEASTEFLRLRPAHAARRARLAVALLNLGRAEDADREIRAAARADSADDTVKATLPTFERLRAQLPALRTLDGKIKGVSAGPPKDADPLTVAPNFASLPSFLLDRALIFLEAGAPFAALADTSRALDADTTSLAALLLKGQCLWRLNREPEAVALRVAKVPDAAAITADRARFDRMRLADGGIRAPEPRGAAKARAVRASELLASDQPVLALPEAEFASRLNAEHNLRYAEVEVILAAALLRNDRPADALLAARRATEQDPRSADGWAMLGRLEQESRADLPAAVANLSRSLAIREEPRWLQRRELCLRTLGRNAEADRDRRRLDQLEYAPPPAAGPAKKKSAARVTFRPFA